MPTRHGALLIIVTGISALILSLAVAFLTVMRSDGQQTLSVVQDVQARAMLVAAQCYIEETARLGWGEEETLGWNDIRSHAVGPIPITQDPWEGPVEQPTHAVWVAGQWPAPGTVLRAPMWVWERPPFAIRAGSRNRIVVQPAGQAGASGLEDDPVNANAVVLVNHQGMSGSYSLMPDIWRLGKLDDPDPAPVLDPTVDPVGWRSGDAQARVGTNHLAWFRIYRERPQDHDGDGDPYYDVVNCNGGRAPNRNGVEVDQAPNASIFLITCGAGASLGFRNWAEVLSAGAGAAFHNDPEIFAMVRSEESLLWFRTEWSPFIGDYSGKGLRQGQAPPGKSHPINSDAERNDGFASASTYITQSHFGSIRWTQRLDREPPTW